MKAYKLVLLVALALVAAACSDDEAPFVKLPEPIALNAEENIITFDVSSNVGWKLTVSDPWFKITPKHGSGKTTLKLGVDRNKTGAARTATIEFAYANGTVERLEVSQAAYMVEMEIKAPESVVVKKDEQLSLAISANTEDWVYTLTDGDWLKEASKTAEALVFNLDPSVRFDEAEPARLRFTSDSDPLFERLVSVKPIDFVKFTAQAPESVEVKEGAQLTVDVESNVADWTYAVTNGAWLKEKSRTATRLVFDLLPDQLLDASVKARIKFSSPSYANLASTLEIQPVSTGPAMAMVDKSKMKAFVLPNDGVVANNANVASAYLFDGKWMTNKSDYSPIAYKHWELSTTNDDANAGHGDSFVIDAGVPVKLAKFVTYHYYDYVSHDPLIYEIYAYTGAGEPAAEWTDWKCLGKVDVTEISKIVKALPAKAYSEHIANGDTLVIEEADAVTARYYRFKTLKNGYNFYGEGWGVRNHWLTLSEVSLFGYK